MKRLFIFPIIYLLISCVPKNTLPVLSTKEEFNLPVKWTETITPSLTLKPTSSITITSTITLTNSNTPIPVSNSDLTKTSKKNLENWLRSDKTDGFYLVNIDIAPGVWRSHGTSDDCYWATTTKTGDIIANHFGMAGGTAYISVNAYQVEFSRCGLWTYLSEP
jgi:hypothetical protein